VDCSLGNSVENQLTIVFNLSSMEPDDQISTRSGKMLKKFILSAMLALSFGSAIIATARPAAAAVDTFIWFEDGQGTDDPVCCIVQQK
jgi:hypothetical protein